MAELALLFLVGAIAAGLVLFRRQMVELAAAAAARVLLTVVYRDRWLRALKLAEELQAENTHWRDRASAAVDGAAARASLVAQLERYREDARQLADARDVIREQQNQLVELCVDIALMEGAEDVAGRAAEIARGLSRLTREELGRRQATTTRVQ